MTAVGKPHTTLFVSDVDSSADNQSISADLCTKMGSSELTQVVELLARVAVYGLFVFKSHWVPRPSRTHLADAGDGAIRGVRARESNETIGGWRRRLGMFNWMEHRQRSTDGALCVVCSHVCSTSEPAIPGVTLCLHTFCIPIRPPAPSTPGGS